MRSSRGCGSENPKGPVWSPVPGGNCTATANAATAIMAVVRKGIVNQTVEGQQKQDDKTCPLKGHINLTAPWDRLKPYGLRAKPTQIKATLASTIAGSPPSRAI